MQLKIKTILILKYLGIGGLIVGGTLIGYFIIWPALEPQLLKWKNQLGNIKPLNSPFDGKEIKKFFDPNLNTLKPATKNIKYKSNIDYEQAFSYLLPTSPYKTTKSKEFKKLAKYKPKTTKSKEFKKLAKLRVL